MSRHRAANLRSAEADEPCRECRRVLRILRQRAGESKWLKSITTDLSSRTVRDLISKGWVTQQPGGYSIN